MNRSLLATPAHQSTRISEYAARNPGTIDLTVGLPAYGPPAAIYTAMREALDRNGQIARDHDRYAPVRGVPALREAIADLYMRTSGMKVDPESEILITHGAAGGLWLATLTATDQGDEVLLPDPCYMLYEPIVTVLGRVPVRVPTASADGFRIDPDTVRSRITSRSRLMMLNTPANPTGAVLGPRVLTELADLADRYGMRIIYDEVLDAFSYEAPHVRLNTLAPEISISVNSLSKRFGMSGWRIGWLVAEPSFITEAAKAQTFNTLSVSNITQRACAVGLADRSTDAEVAQHVKSVEMQGRRLAAGLAAVPFIEPTPFAGGFYLFVKVRAYAARLNPQWTQVSGQSAGNFVADHLLTAAKVAVVPGGSFGPSGNDYIRLSFPGPADGFDEAVHRIEAAVTGRTAREEHTPCA
jgi:aspartate/methionine/tyrosine aminotransferase